jgi:hypothetical protein
MEQFAEKKMHFSTMDNCKKMNLDDEFIQLGFEGLQMTDQVALQRWGIL